MGDFLTGDIRAGLPVEGFGEGGGIVKRTVSKFLGLLGITWLWSILEEGWEGEVLDWLPIELGTTLTSSPSSSSLPSSLGLVVKPEILLSLFATPWLLTLEMGTYELE
ncbi:hypothetical protein O181_071881 [Austropuccinia psidii MF-1]|uniref:Uncharacterized protein n=1 Tax=Austropuccinia psidii MF-1 TaxID=1389203 RepID=A0A9Q3I6X3_9BASI|nr:hypothetical protein [Austropuccinia psidii MF-1]